MSCGFAGDQDDHDDDGGGTCDDHDDEDGGGLCVTKNHHFLKRSVPNHESDVTWFHSFSCFLVGFHGFSR